MTEQRQKLLDEFNSWFDTNPNKRILAAQCANIAEKYAAEQLKLYGVSNQREQFTDFLIWYKNSVPANSQKNSQQLAEEYMNL